jgi:hypothetical protein
MDAAEGMTWQALLAGNTHHVLDDERWGDRRLMETFSGCIVSSTTAGNSSRIRCTLV